MEAANADDWSHVSSRFDLNSSAGVALSVIARVGSGCWIVGVIAGAVGIIWAHSALARLVLKALW